MSTLDPLNATLAPTAQRRAALAATLPRHIDLLWKRRASEVPQDDLEAYVALGWMRWAGGRLVITPQGVAMRDDVVDNEGRRAER
jgi:hypothetical protein